MKSSFAFGLVLLACSRAPARHEAPPKPSAAPSASAAVTPAVSKEAWLGAIEQLAALHRNNAKDCDRLSSELESFATAHQTELAARDPAVFRAIDSDDALRARLQKAMETIMTSSMACHANPRFTALHTRLRVARAR